MNSVAFTLRPARPIDLDALLEIWVRSVRATHRFLSETDIQSLLPQVRDEVLPTMKAVVLCDGGDTPIGFMGVVDDAIDALFIDPEYLGQGGGSRLVEYARRHLKRPLRVDVNEQNDAAIAFYESQGFRVVARSATDEGGRPFPLLHMREMSEE